MENEIQNESVRPEETAAPVAAEPQEPVAAQAEPAAAQTEPAPAEEPAAQPAEEKREENTRPRPEPVPVTEEMLANSKKILATMLDYLGLEGTVKAEGKPGKINLLIASDDAGRIIGRKGQSLESLQVLVNRIMQKGDAPCPKIYIDIDGYSSNSKRGERRDGERRPFRGGRRSFQKSGEDRGFERSDRAEHSDRNGFGSDKDEQLRQQALDSAKEVRRWGEPVTLPQMNAHDRRIIHITLEKEADLVTESVGEGNFKSVVITLKKDN
ncbi:MAG: KH domain-containing protein [Lentisphaeria bacterium]|nr:KH domain-containing protein [Lentisphaeria bacterium]